MTDKQATYLCRATEVTEGKARQLDVPGHPEPFAIFRLKGRFFLTDDTCTHAMASLSAGEVEGDTVICPLHGGVFNICTGAALEAPCTVPLRTYPIYEKDGDLYGILDD